MEGTRFPITAGLIWERPRAWRGTIHLVWQDCTGVGLEYRQFASPQEFELIKTLEEASKSIKSVSWSSQLLATGGYDQIVRIYDAAQDLGTGGACLLHLDAGFDR